jgi:hypothetical protein
MSMLVRCIPHADREFEVDVAAEIVVAEGQAGAVLSGLRDKYPRILIVERMQVARTDGEDEAAWYCYRDGPAIAGYEVGTSQSRTRVETLGDDSLDLIDWARDVLLRSRAALAEAPEAAARSRPSSPDARRDRGTRLRSIRLRMR